ncbi:GATA transcription factor 19-like protein [Carex littledalei]|uniref:GATA transcription factor 19-like protein n=1 Tax=Carex littledalei TaxID=544730 RepID=A0A833QGA7_9POAL|nr:GATA transcription factor 19-like protein [Carex littledalei]
MAPSFSILFPISSSNCTDEELSDNYSSITSSSPTSSTSSVDCTLSLGTPSTRQNNGNWYKQSSSTAMYWDILSQPKKNETSGCNAALKGCNGNGTLGGDPILLARRCANCDTTSTPLWRNGPRGPKSLCNACGIRYKKEERRAATTSAIPVEQGTACGYQQTQPWTFYGSTKSGHISIYGHDSSDNADMASYLPWRFSAVPVQERTTLYQYN